MLSPDFTTLPDQQIHDKLICIVCTEPLDDPRMHTCGNMFCKKCLPIPVLKKCPGCNVEFKSQTEFDNPVPMLAKNMLDEIMVKCIHCDETMKREKALEHKTKLCPNRVVQCNAIFKNYRGIMNGLNDKKAILIEIARECTLQCPWEGKLEDFAAHLCTTKQLQKAANSSFCLMINATLCNFVDPKVCNSSTGWIEVPAPTKQGDKYLFRYRNPHTEEIVVESLALNDARWGEYYTERDGGVASHTVLHVPPPAPQARTRSKKRKTEAQTEE